LRRDRNRNDKIAKANEKPRSDQSSFGHEPFSLTHWR
jgi:hypothetical protein